MYNTNQLQPPRTPLDELPSQGTSEFPTLVSTLPESPKQQPELPIPGVTSRGAPSPGKVRNLDSPRACGVAERRT